MFAMLQRVEDKICQPISPIVSTTYVAMRLASHRDRIRKLKVAKKSKNVLHSNLQQVLKNQAKMLKNAKNKDELQELRRKFSIVNARALRAWRSLWR